jgi:DNA-binding MarR family transcriptional regulator
MSERMMKRKWMIFSNHGIVLAYIAKHPKSTTPEIAQKTLLSVWGVQRIIADLEKDGYIGKIRNGRCNQYEVYSQLPLRHRLMRHCTVGKVLQSIGYKPENV